MANEPIVAQSLVEQVTGRVEAAILDGSIPLGSKIKEQQLAMQLGVSRGPLREAIRSLEGRKLIERIPNRGPRVIAMSPNDLMDLLVMREALEGIACSLATTNATPADLDELELLAEAGGLDSSAFTFDDDIAFHRKILRMSGNKRIDHLLNFELYYLLKIYRLRSKRVPGRSAEARREHQDILRAMRERDVSLAETMMRRHIRKARENIIQSLESQ